jgi:uncharacterized protein (DUF983 family)
MLHHITHNANQRPAALPAPWVTRLTCPACRTPEALLAFDGVGTVCAECGDTTRVVMDDGTEDA